MPRPLPLVRRFAPKANVSAIQAARSLLDEMAMYEIDGPFLITVEDNGDYWAVQSERLRKVAGVLYPEGDR
jgi:hypothetical protein